MANGQTRETRPFFPALVGLENALRPLGAPLIRIVAGLMLMPHGAQKLFGAFGGGGLSGTAEGFGRIGIEPALPMAALAGGVEFFGGLMLAIGLFTRPAAVAVGIVMLVAVFKVHWANGFFASAGGFEYALLWGVVAAGFAMRGGGRYSVDAAIGREI
ncbi:MAG: DoxX family membrane protein [Alphaproteobacteria bacterium]|nr:DoxX family membrane protein [Alphaproteobacteria bacterium]